MSTGDAHYIKNLNRRILIEQIIKEKTLSRSDLARDTGLNKATVSAQISALIDEGIVRETKIGSIDSPGRKPILIEINGDAGYSIGIDVDTTEVRAVFIDLKGFPFHKEVIETNEGDLDQLISIVRERLKPLMDQFNTDYDPIGLTGICVGIHGIINNDNEIVFTPKQQWTNTDLKEKLESEIDVPVYIDNNANLSAFGEQVYFENISDLFCITLYSGIGLGIINNYTIYRGYEGFAGEVGHMIVQPEGQLCTCGNLGCWEQYASEKVLKQKLSNRFENAKDNYQTLLTEDSFKGDLEEFSKYLAIGLNNIINIFNPQRIVLNGALINENPQVIEEMEGLLKSKINSYETIHISRLGEFACALGGAAYVLKNYLNVNTLDYMAYEYFDQE
ncbi:ROK family transcriptional regulator [Alkalibacillus haloalkaliphilus]|uniref:Xylose repressor n=1 Tax=Alkalibacillus haloalkaliphilus TaxID=94136 RepID=A0A511W4H6_9BACI|nr:ROK family transcriptional regulator [Alkalibacillus haloalkaliphilus]GEN45985.1 xylose repressor [Alkalibacillus haloalkaliphilus]